MLYLLQELKYQEIMEYKNYYNNIKLEIINKINGLDTNRIDVHNKMFYVDKYKNLSTYNYINDKNIYEIKTNLLRLIDQDSIDDTCSKSLNYRIGIIQLSILDERIDSSKQQIQLLKTAQALLKKASIQDIYEKKDILKELTEENYYANLDFFKLESLKDSIGPLIKYLKGEEDLVYVTNFNDTIETKERNVKYNFDDFRTYREKIILYIQQHFGELKSVNKIMSLQSLDMQDLKELQNILNSLKNSNEDKDEFSSTQEFIIFIRKIIGMDRELIDKKCMEFINKNKFSKEQRQLINLIIDFAIRNGNVTADDLVNLEPFCEFEIDTIFNNDLDPILKLIALFNETLNILFNLNIKEVE